MLLGRTVFVFHTSNLLDPHPGIVTAEHPEAVDIPDAADVNIFYPWNHQNPPTVAVARIPCFANMREVRDWMAKAPGTRYVAVPYDPANPQLEDDAPAKKPAAAAKSK